MRIDLGLAYIKDSDKCKQQPNKEVSYFQLNKKQYQARIWLGIALLCSQTLLRAFTILNDRYRSGKFSAIILLYTRIWGDRLVKSLK